MIGTSLIARPSDRSASRGPAIRAAALGAVLVVVLTYPTVPLATSAGRLDTNDGRFSIWNVAWIDHALLTDPSNLLNANIFWPHQGTLAYSELNLVAGLLGLPWYAATRSPLAALNGAIASALVLSFVLTAALVRRLTGSEGAGLVSAVAFTFCPYVTAHTAHVQLLMIFAFPLVALAMHRLVEAPGPGRAAWLGAALALAALACGYYGIFAACVLGFLALCLAEWRVRYWTSLAIAAAVAALLLLPVYRTFDQARQRSGVADLARTAEDARGYSANVAAYLASSAAAHEWWLASLQAWQPWAEVLFPGVGLIGLAGLGLVAASRTIATRRLAWTYAALAAAAGWASFGPDGGLYTLVRATVPGASLLRAPARFGIVVVFALAILAGFGAARLVRGRWWATGLLVLALSAELGVRTDAWGWPSWPLRRAEPVPVAYQTLATLPRGVVVEYQFPYERSNYHNHAVAMYWSTYHWQPLVNGYSDLRPSDFDEIALPINFFPDPASFEIMRARNVRYVLWHIDYYRGEGEVRIRERLERYAQYVRPIVHSGDVWLYEIIGWP